MMVNHLGRGPDGHERKGWRDSTETRTVQCIATDGHRKRDIRVFSTLFRDRDADAQHGHVIRVSMFNDVVFHSCGIFWFPGHSHERVDAVTEAVSLVS